MIIMTVRQVATGDWKTSCTGDRNTCDSFSGKLFVTHRGALESCIGHAGHPHNHESEIQINLIRQG